jgi:hypothetical protein
MDLLQSGLQAAPGLSVAMNVVVEAFAVAALPGTARLGSLH